MRAASWYLSWSLLCWPSINSMMHNTQQMCQKYLWGEQVRIGIRAYLRLSVLIDYNSNTKTALISLSPPAVLI